mmetsp:Transcript_9059/g.18809  ORF Transcript_9059/g.18809 Transcript_9059/m.18809 type:complete len:237 (+) Transcript_9059:996-1706(+)
MIKVFLLNNNAVQNLLIHMVFIEINKTHLASDTFEGGFHTKLLEIGSDITMSVACQKFCVNIGSEFHISCHNLKNFQSAFFVRNTHIKLSVESSGTTKSWFNHARTIGGSNNNNLRRRFQSIHKGQQLRNNTLFNFATRLFSLWSDGIDFIDKDDSTVVVVCVCFGVLKSASQVGFTLTSALRNNFRAINDKEVCTCFSSNCSGHGSLTGTRRTGEQNSAWWIDSEFAPEFRMTKG